MKLLLGLILLASCTDNTRARAFGGTETVTLPLNHRLVNITWKENDLWVLTQDTLTKEFIFSEKSSAGLMEGTIKFKSKSK